MSGKGATAAAAGGAPPPQSARESKLRAGFEKSVRAWRTAVDNAGALEDAFGGTPLWASAPQRRELQTAVNRLWDGIQGYLNVELKEMLDGAGLTERLAALEDMKDLAEGRTL